MRISKEVLGDLVAGGLEGVTGYWAGIEQVIAPKKISFDVGTELLNAAMNKGGEIHLFDLEDEESKAVLTYAKLKAGVEVLREKYPHLWKEVVQDRADSATGDALVQCALYGEIVYG